jgi:hypothetical protein
MSSVTLTFISYLSVIQNLIALPPDCSNYGSISLTNSSNISLCPSDKLYTLILIQAVVGRRHNDVISSSLSAFLKTLLLVEYSFLRLLNLQV